ncbi:hypothetical protein ACRAWG_36780 [Methylobacterium sp. P31]
MSGDRKSWHSPAELALACDCTADAVEALARRHHWPRIHGENGGKIGVDVETGRDALLGRPGTVYGRMPLR